MRSIIPHVLILTILITGLGRPISVYSNIPITSENKFGNHNYSGPVTLSREVVYNDELTNRSYFDRPDDINGSQFHAFYVIPSDGIDRQYDINGALNRSIHSFLKWMNDITSGDSLIMDTYNGTLDITFAILNSTDDEIYANDVWVRDEIENELWEQGLIEDPRFPGDKIYAVYYDGRSNWSCGGASYFSGNVVAMYLKGEPPGYPKCDTRTFTNDVNTPKYWEFAMLHDLIHGLGIVDKNAPNHIPDGHSGDTSEDLMYSGSQPWSPRYFDFNNDDYYRHSGDYKDLEDSDYLFHNHSTLISTKSGLSETGSDQLSFIKSATLLFTGIIIWLIISLGITKVRKKRF